MTAEEKAKEMQTNLNKDFSDMVQRYFDGYLTFDDMKVQSLGIIDNFEKIENDAVNHID